MTRPDVLVVGAGPVGATCALLLADAGLRVALVDRDTAPGDEPRAISITDDSLRLLRQLGVLEGLLPTVLTGAGSRYVGRKGRVLLDARPARQLHGHPAKSHFDQPELNAQLWEAIERRLTLDLITGVELTSLEQSSDGVVAHLATADGVRELSASWLVGADGGRSTVRRELGIELTGATQAERWLVVDVLGEPPRERRSEFRCDGIRPHVIVPVVDGRCRYEFMIFDGESEEQLLDPAAVAELLAPYRELGAGQLRRARVYTAHRRIAARYREGRALLVGDAAHLMPPFAGQGLNSGLRDAANLAWKLAEVVHGRASGALLDSYEAERRPHTLAMIGISGRIGRLVMLRGRAAPRLRDAAVLLARRLPRIGPWLRALRFIATPALRGGLILPAGRGVPARYRALVGTPIPQPTVVRADGGREPLDVALGSGWALVALDGASVEDDAWAPVLERTVALGRSGTGPADSLVDLDGFLVPIDPAAPAEPVLLVVRPDRYVAAAVLPGEQRSVAARLAEMLGRPAAAARP